MTEREEDSPQEKVDLCNGTCFGKQKIRRGRGEKNTWSFRGNCNEQCRLKNDCFSESVQKYEERFYGIRDNEKESTSENSPEVQFAYPDGSNDEVLSQTLGGFAITPESRAVIFEFVRRLYMLYISRPVLFDVMMRRFFEHQDVADIARVKNVSRQNMSASLAREIAGMKPEKVQFRETLRGFERSVYELCFEDGCTIRSAAMQLGVSKDKVYRVRQKIRTKNEKSATSGNTKSKKKAKK